MKKKDNVVRQHEVGKWLAQQRFLAMQLVISCVLMGQEILYFEPNLAQNEHL